MMSSGALVIHAHLSSFTGAGARQQPGVAGIPSARRGEADRQKDTKKNCRSLGSRSKFTDFRAQRSQNSKDFKISRAGPSFLDELDHVEVAQELDSPRLESPRLESPRESPRGKDLEDAWATVEVAQHQQKAREIDMNRCVSQHSVSLYFWDLMWMSSGRGAGAVSLPSKPLNSEPREVLSGF